MRNRRSIGIVVVVVALALACIPRPKGVETNPASKTQQAPREEFDDKIAETPKDICERGRKTFRYDTFGDEEFWGGQLRLHQAIWGRSSAASALASRRTRRWSSASRWTSARCPKLLVEAIQRGVGGPRRPGRRRWSCCGPTRSSA